MTVLQMLPALEGGGVERGTLEVGKYLVEHGHRSLVMSAGGRMVAQLEREGSEHFTWLVGKKSLWTLRLIWKLRRFLIEQKVDILHVRSRMPGWVAYLAWKGMDPARRPHLVTTVHGPYTVNAYSAVMTKGERVIAISEFIRDYIQKHYPEVSPDKIRLIYRGVDPAQFPYGYKPSLEWMGGWYKQYPELIGRHILTLPARLTRWKGQEDFIELIRRLRNRGLSVHGVMVGEPHASRHDFLKELQEHARAAGVLEHLTFAGHRTDIKDVMAASSIVYSLAQEPEAFGRTTLEALSLGIPAIGYAHGGVGEQLAAIYPDGLVRLRDLDQLEEVTLSLLKTLHAVSNEHSFTLEEMLKNTLGVYEELSSADVCLKANE